MNIKKAFTVVEMMIVIVIIGVGLLGVIGTLSHSYKFLYNTKNKISAINIARAGIESVFNMRNTNWQRWGGKKDLCWLKIDPLVDDGNDGCESDTWFQSGSYVLISKEKDEQKYFALSGAYTTPLKLEGKLESTDWNYLVCKKDGIISKCEGNPTSKPTNYFHQMLFFQQIRGGYLLDKQDNNIINCSKGNDTNCGDGRSLEKNFCVDVVFFDGHKNKLSLCSVLTNFKK